MTRRFFIISMGVAVPLLIVSIIGSIGLFSSPDTILEDYRRQEKQLGKLFEKYEKESETMTDAEFTNWQKEVKQLSGKAAETLIEIQKDPEHWQAYLDANELPNIDSPFADPEYTGLAAKSLKDISSDEFDAWLQARDQQRNDQERAIMRAEGIWDDEKIEEIIAQVNESLANNPTLQSDRKKMRNILLKREARAREKVQHAREEAEYQAWRKEFKEWLAEEEVRLSEMSADERFGGSPESPTEPAEQTPDTSDADLFPADAEMPSVRPPSENAVAPQSIPTEQEPDRILDTQFHPDAFAASLSEEMSAWRADLEQTYSDVFRLDAAFEQSLPEAARHHFQQRKQRLQYEYVNRLHAVLREIPTAHREKTLRIVRETLMDKWDADFAESVLRQLNGADK